MLLKRAIQLSLSIVLILTLYVFYLLYFKSAKQPEKTEKNEIYKQSLTHDKKDNLIKNLEYEVILSNSRQYIIKSELSELSNDNNSSLINMQKVTASITDNENFPLIITSDIATYDDINYDTSFKKNVVIKYSNNLIFANNLDLNFKENMIKVYGNVFFNGEQLSMRTDNIKINMLSKKIDVYMSEEQNNVEIITKENVKY
tara:strand:+ start:68 stop:670 length:603 start_codon:yes stop_codon:yes gene_type:complete